MLRQAGIAADDLVGTIEMLGNVSGGSMERFNRIAYNAVVSCSPPGFISTPSRKLFRDKP
jgi:hypothetical protein